MLSGFNTNYRHRGVLFHVQTEDSGVGKPHVITHLFHGGNILASVKLDYSEHLSAADLEVVVKGLMESQHKSMLQRLKRGAYDSVIYERLGDESFAGAGGDTASTAADVSETDGSSTEPSTDAIDRSQAEPTVIVEPEDEPSEQERMQRAFGAGVVSQKPLDEVVLDYLVENARKRKRRSP